MFVKLRIITNLVIYKFLTSTTYTLEYGNNVFLSLVVVTNYPRYFFMPLAHTDF